jgi:hypothetical protein
MVDQKTNLPSQLCPLIPSLPSPSRGLAGEKNKKRPRLRLRPSHCSPPPLLASVSRCTALQSPFPTPRRRCTPTHSVAAIRCVSSSRRCREVALPGARGSRRVLGLRHAASHQSHARDFFSDPDLNVSRGLPPRSGSGGLEGLAGPDHSTCRRAPVAGNAGVSGSGRRPLVSGNAPRVGVRGGTPWPADAAVGLGEVDGHFGHEVSVSNVSLLIYLLLRAMVVLKLIFIYFIPTSEGCMISNLI